MIQQLPPWEWFDMPKPIKGMIMWGTVQPPFQYIVSYDEQYKQWGASVAGYDHNTTDYLELGHDFRNRALAEDACFNHYLSMR